MPAHSRSQNGVAELVIGPATSGRTRWLAYCGHPRLHAVEEQVVDGRIKSGHGDREGPGSAAHHFMPRCARDTQRGLAELGRKGAPRERLVIASVSEAIQP
jgi:hypothetical protein